MTALKKENLERIRKFIKFITFVNMPIREKFFLFLVGVLFWFFLMCAISITTSVIINSKTDRIVDHLLPHERISHKLARKLYGVNADVSDLLVISSAKDLRSRIAIADLRLNDINSFIQVFVNGGETIDINRDTGRIIDSIVIREEEDSERDHYLSTLYPNLAAIKKGINEIAEIKLSDIKNEKSPDASLIKKASGLKLLISDSISSSNDYAASEASMYSVAAEKIRYVTMLMPYTFVTILMIATILLILFTISISRSIARPVKAIIEQIRSVGEGRVDITNKIKVSSKDEIGTLTEDFNELMDEIHELAVFKKVIEEDDSLEDVYSRLAGVFDKFGLDDFIIYEVSNSQNKMKPVFPIILNENEINCNPDILHNCNLCKVKKTGHVISSFEYPKICKQYNTDLDMLHVCLPMHVSGGTGGVVQFLFNKKYYGIDGRDRRIYKVEQYINEAVPVIEAKRLMDTLRESALKDSLTGLYNRRFLQEYTETLIAGVLRRKKSIGLLMCDLDYFKQVNDVYGHNVGDNVLKETSKIIEKCVRSSDLVIRFGGEEFLVIILDIQEGESMEISEKIRTSIEEAKIKVFDGSIKKTISLGISEFPTDTDSFWQAIKYADVALYKAKETGRNRSVRFTEEMWKEEDF